MDPPFEVVDNNNDDNEDNVLATQGESPIGRIQTDINAPAMSSMLGGRFIPPQGGNSSTGSRMNLTSKDDDGTPSKEVFVEGWVYYSIYQDNVDQHVQRLQSLFQPDRFNVEKGMVKIEIYDHAHCRGVYLFVYYYD